MPGEQEQANEYFLRLSMDGGSKFAKLSFQIIKLLSGAIHRKVKSRGGLRNYKALKKSNEPLKQIDISHVKDMDRFDALAKAHKIQYAITNDPSNPDKEFFWFKARNEDEINAFLVAVLDLGKELEKELPKELPKEPIDTPEDLLKKKKESEEVKEGKLYKFHEQSFEEHEYRVTDFETFEELKAYVAERYDPKLNDLDLDITSFNDVNDIKELEGALSMLDKKEIKTWVERESIFKGFHEKEPNSNEPTYDIYEHSFETKEVKKMEFKNIEELKSFIGESYKAELKAAGISSRSFKKIHSVEDLNAALAKLDQSKGSIKVERKDPVKESTSKEQQATEPKFKLFEGPEKSTEQKVTDFDSFNDLKEYLTRNYQDKLVASGLGSKSFSDISSTKEMNEVFTHLAKSDSSIQLTVKRKSLVKEFSEKEKQAKERKEPKDKVNVKETNHER